MRRISQQIYHRLFILGIIGKAVFSVGEIIAGVAFYLFSKDEIRSIAFTIFGGEIQESPQDFFWSYAVRSMHDFAKTPQSVWAFIFLSHGIVKLILAEGLWHNRLWAYPASAIVFTGFVIYQFYQLTFTPSLILWLITIFDIVLIVLIMHEYRRKLAQRSLVHSPARPTPQG